LINELIKQKISLIIIKQDVIIIADKYDITLKIMVTFFSLFGELQYDMVSLRIKEALSAKEAQDIKLGKPVGTIQKSKFDKDIEKIKELLQYGLSVRKIENHMDYPNYISLNKHLNKRGIKGEVNDTLKTHATRYLTKSILLGTKHTKMANISAL